MARPTKTKSEIRSKKFTLLLTKDESMQLRELSTHMGEPASILIRRFIREQHTRAFQGDE